MINEYSYLCISEYNVHRAVILGLNRTSAREKYQW